MEIMNTSELVGLRFRPTDEEIMMYFLEIKMGGIDFPVHAINEVDILKYDPWELPQLSVLLDDHLWYFFSAPSYKYPNSKRNDRTTSNGTGFWKKTGIDREIKDKRTGDVIGFRKTLVFQKGRNPNAVGTNWVMHEFHSCNASSYQKEFVFCRIKRKSNVKAGTLIVEPSSYGPFNSGNHGAQNSGPQDWLLNSGNYGARNISSQVNLELPMELDEDDFSLLRLVMHPEQGLSPSNESNNGSNMCSQLDISEQENDFVNSLLADEVNLYDETIHTRPHGCNPTKSLRGVYVGDSSDSDTETLLLQSDLETPKLSNGNARLKEYQQMQRVRAPTETPSPSSRDQRKKGENGFFHDEISASFVNSKTYEPKTMRLVLGALPTNTRACEAQPRPKSHNLVEKECVLKRKQLQGEFSSKAISRVRASKAAEHAIGQPQKENSVVKLGKDQKMAQTTHAKTNLQARSTRFDSSNRKDSFISLETSPLNHKQNPPLVYIRNVVVGVFLSVICFWEMTSLH